MQIAVIWDVTSCMILIFSCVFLHPGDRSSRYLRNAYFWRYGINSGYCGWSFCFEIVMPYSVVKIFGCFGGTCCIISVGQVASSSETLVQFYQIARRHIPQDNLNW